MEIKKPAFTLAFLLLILNTFFQLLKQRFKAGNKTAVLAELHGRSDNAIRSRLKKLGVIKAH